MVAIPKKGKCNNQAIKNTRICLCYCRCHCYYCSSRCVIVSLSLSHTCRTTHSTNFFRCECRSGTSVRIRLSPREGVVSGSEIVAILLCAKERGIDKERERRENQ